MPAKTKEERAAYARAWRAANPDKVKAAEARKRAKQLPGAATERMRRWRAANPEKVREQIQRQRERRDPEKERDRWRRYRAKNIDKVRAYNAKWHRENRANNPAAVRQMALKSKYGITQADYDRMLSEQNNSCAACHAPAAKEKFGVLHVDHCHKTGKVRGLLCTKCNTALGLFGDDPAVIRRAIAYIKGEPLPPI